MNFTDRWLARFGVSPSNWRTEIALHLEMLPFIEAEKAILLLDFLFTQVPAIDSVCEDQEARQLAEAYAWCCLAFWQCESAFPALPENYAEYLKTALETPLGQRDESAIVLARLITEFNAKDGQCGLNKLILEEPETLRESERLNHEGRYDIYLNSQEKYDEYVYFLENSPEFQSEWQLIRTTYSGFVEGQSILRRSPIPERNWLRGADGAQFHEESIQFQAIFDFFCWKYFLWGMDGDKPLLLKTSAVCTPYGTQIFIPGYLSFDAKRDLNFAQISRLHRARGIPRQGPGYSVGRREQAELQRKAKAADAEAKAKGLRGVARYSYICEQTGFRDTEDFRRLRSLLESKKTSL